jgi:glycine cleavage system H protein
MNIPGDLKYTKEHEWVKIDGNVAVVGVTDFAQNELTDITFFEFPEIGREVNQMDEVGVIETSKAVAEIYSPLSGKIVGVNSVLDDNPDQLKNDPYGEGWLIKIEMTNAGELDGLMDADTYKALIE